MAVRGAQASYTRIAAPRPHLNGIRREQIHPRSVFTAHALWTGAYLNQPGTLSTEDILLHSCFLEVKIKGRNVYRLGLCSLSWYWPVPTYSAAIDRGGGEILPSLGLPSSYRIDTDIRNTRI